MRSAAAELKKTVEQGCVEREMCNFDRRVTARDLRRVTEEILQEAKQEVRRIEDRLERVLMLFGTQTRAETNAGCLESARDTTEQTNSGMTGTGAHRGGTQPAQKTGGAQMNAAAKAGARIKEVWLRGERCRLL